MDSGYIVKVFGTVQGVGFRYYTQQKAISLVVNGRVQNEMDGTVTVQICGPEERVIQMLDWLHTGPDSATVDKLDYHSMELYFEDFKIVR